MAIPTRALDLLDQHLYGNLSKAANKEALQGINEAYAQLSYRQKPVTFYDSDNFVGDVNMLGGVEFQRKYPNLGTTSYASPTELIDKVKNQKYYNQDKFGRGDNGDPEAKFARLKVLEQYASEPNPTKEMIQMSRAFQDYSNSPEGARLYYNQPLSPHRAKAYLKQGFENVQVYDDDGIPELVNRQFIDKRPYADQDIVNKLYMFGDIQKYGEIGAQALYNQRLRNIGKSGLALPEKVITKAKIPAYEYYEPIPQAELSPWDIPF